MYSVAVHAQRARNRREYIKYVRVIVSFIRIYTNRHVSSGVEKSVAKLRTSFYKLLRKIYFNLHRCIIRLSLLTIQLHLDKHKIIRSDKNRSSLLLTCAHF